MNCHACGAQLAGTARFCHKCGAQVGGAPPQAAGWRGGLPWGVAGIAVGALLTVLALRLGAGSREPGAVAPASAPRSEEHTSELQSRLHLVCRLLLEKKRHKGTRAELEERSV